MKVKELKEMLANMNDDYEIVGVEVAVDRDDYEYHRKVKIIGVVGANAKPAYTEYGNDFYF